MIKMHSGGCQCGAVRYRINGELMRPHICHCRMCQKAAGNYFMSLAGVAKENLEITRGEISWFLSSDPVRRGFCSACGTPLAIDTMAEPVIHMTLGSLDDPDSVHPERQYGTEARVPFFDKLPALPGTTTEGDGEEDQAFLAQIRDTTHQHPDHETETWPPVTKGGAW